MTNKNLTTMIISALLLAIGLVFHTVVPGIFFGMKPDFILGFMFIAFLLKPSFLNAIVIGLAGGYLSGITTSFPGGFLPNFLEKPITMIGVYVVVLLLQKVLPKYITYRTKQFHHNYIIIVVIGSIGTLISGTLFLLLAGIIIGLPEGASFMGLFIGVVIPTTIINAVATTIFYTAFDLATIRSSANFQLDQEDIIIEVK